MSFPSLSSIEPTISEDELKSAAASIGITIPSSKLPTYQLFASAFDTACTTVLSLPPYADPRVAAIRCNEPRAFTYPSPASNPLNAWSQTTSLTATHPTSNLLAGKTIALKANISVAGADLNIGTQARFFPNGAYHIPSTDASVVRRVLLAGATVLGTGTCENFSLSALGITAHTGPVGNAWAPDRAAGGSSSGATTLVSLGPAKGGVDMAVGGDQGGSIRVPAHFAGVYGMKPTWGLVPYTGVASLFSAIDHAGPIARSLEDLAVLLEVLAGADGVDPRQGPWTPVGDRVPKYSTELSNFKAGTAQKAATGLKVGVLKEGWEIAGLNEEVAKVTKEAVDRFTALGAEVVEVSVPMHKLAPLLWTVYNRHGLMDTLTNSPSTSLGHPMVGFEPLSSRPSQGGDPKTVQAFFDYISTINPSISNALLNAPLLKQKYGPELTRKAQLHVHELIAAYDAVFEAEKLDVIVLPVNGNVSPLISKAIKVSEVMAETGPKTEILTELDEAGMASELVGLTLNTCAFNLSGHPAMSLPCGWATPKDGPGPEKTGGKMPVGLQIVGRKWDELAVLKAAAAWETGGKAIPDQLGS